MLSNRETLIVDAPRQPDDRWSEFVVAVFGVNGLIMRAGESIVRPIEQTSARWQVLGSAFEPQTVAKMAGDMGHARQSVQRVADVLAVEGPVVYTQHPTDRRTKLLELTPEGLEILTAIYHRQLGWSQRVMAKLSLGQLTAVTAALNSIGEEIETEPAPARATADDQDQEKKTTEEGKVADA